MFVKICGLTTLGDTLAAVEAGAQAVGFNFVPTSPRYIEESALAEWIGKVPAHVWKVGVFANHAPEQVTEVCRRLGVNVAQLHGEETPEQVPRQIRVWKAARVRPGFTSEWLAQFDCEALLLDGPASGIPFDWSAIPMNGRKLILAGGLDGSKHS